MCSGKHPEWYERQVKPIKELLASYEIELRRSRMSFEFWKYEAYYFDKLLFAYYPKSNQMFRDVKNKKQMWKAMDADVLKHFETICECFLLTGKIKFRGISTCTLADLVTRKVVTNKK